MQAVGETSTDQQNKRISGFRKSSETIQSSGEPNRSPKGQVYDQNGQGQADQAHPRKVRLFKNHWINVAALLILYDMVVVNLSYLAALWLRFDLKFSTITDYYLAAWTKFTPFYSMFCLAIFWGMRLYKSIWKYASYTELVLLLEATALTGAFHTVFITVFCRRMPISYYLIGIMLQFLFMVGIRFSYRFVLLLRNEHADPDTASRVMVIGAGNGGQAIDERLEALQKELLKKANAKQGYEELADEIDSLREEKQDLLVEEANRAGLKQRLDELEAFLAEQTTEVTDYDEGLVRQLIEKITVYDDHLAFEFKSGLETEVQM